MKDLEKKICQVSNAGLPLCMGATGNSSLKGKLHFSFLRFPTDEGSVPTDVAHPGVGGGSEHAGCGVLRRLGPAGVTNLSLWHQAPPSRVRAVTSTRPGHLHTGPRPWLSGGPVRGDPARAEPGK